MFDLENAISTWRQFLSKSDTLTRDDLDELENHLRFEIKALSPDKFTDEERFRIATKKTGDISELDSFYSSVIWEKRWQRGLSANVAAGLDLLGSYTKTAWNSILRHKGYASLNLLGLTIALSACIIIVLYVQHELSYDSFHSKSERIYRLETIMISTRRGPGLQRTGQLGLDLSLPFLKLRR